MRRLLATLLLLGACGDSPAVTSTVDATTTTATTAAGWVRLANVPTPRSEMSAAVIDGLIYVPGGYTRAVTGEFVTEAVVEVYDPAEDEWSRIADLPEGRNHPMTASLDGRLYVFGGYDPAGQPAFTTFRYDPTSDTWDELAPMPANAAAGGAVALGEHLYVIGGAPNGVLCFRYDPAEDEWIEIASLSSPRDHLAVTTFGGQIYALGGRDGQGELASVEVFDPASGEWLPGPAMLEERSGFGAVTGPWGIIAMGGELVTGQQVTLASAERLDPATGQWVSIEAMPVALHGVAAAALGDTIYLLGGSRRAAGAANSGDALKFTP